MRRADDKMFLLGLSNLDQRPDPGPSGLNISAPHGHILTQVVVDFSEDELDVFLRGGW